MGITRKIRNIAVSQLGALKDRLDKIDLEDESAELQAKRERDRALRELEDGLAPGSQLRTPEQIREGILPGSESSARQTAAGSEIRNLMPATAPSVATDSLHAPPISQTAKYYRVLGLPNGADLLAIEEAYSQLRERCTPSKFPEESAERKAADEILARVEEAYNELRESLDPTAGRFDKLEL